MKKSCFIVTLLLCMTILPGCVEKKVIDDVNIATGIGIDKSEKQFLGSVMIPVFKPDKSFGNFTFKAKGKVIRDLVSEMQKKASQPIVSGSLDIALFGEDVAREGLIKTLDVFLRDPSVGARVQLAVVDGQAIDIFKGKYGDRGNAQYLTQLLEHNMEQQNLPLTNLHRFLAAFYQKGMDPYLPMLKKSSRNLVTISGLALFKDEKLVDILHENKMYYFKLLVDHHTLGVVKVKEAHGESTVKSMGLKKNIRLKGRNPYTFSIKIKLKGDLTEHQERILEKGEIREIENKLAQQISKECKMLVEDFQRKNIDPVGFGHFAKTRTRNFDYKKWNEEYKNAKFEVSADVKLIGHGVVE
ncbi:Ger(x)C family spore germination protein [Bacillus sp. FJAT-29814]|uniref:Ger(x)C family spore germination protein n=1 Tax=Bacillus sp. FJAT-29814 TaxID=1729688 RepID=UPI00082F5398|nr:Ger(x)C family spore germination protein [Bacillus sp. FJAT-29814]